MAASTVHAVLTRCPQHRLSHIDQVTGEPIRRYQHPHHATASTNLRRALRSGAALSMITPGSPTQRSATTRKPGITPKKTSPYRPQANGKVERFHRNPDRRLCYARFCSMRTSPQEGLRALCITTSCTGPPATDGRPISRLTNLPGRHTWAGGGLSLEELPAGRRVPQALLLPARARRAPRGSKFGSADPNGRRPALATAAANGPPHPEPSAGTAAGRAHLPISRVDQIVI